MRGEWRSLSVIVGMLLVPAVAQAGETYFKQYTAANISLTAGVVIPMSNGDIVLAGYAATSRRQTGMVTSLNSSGNVSYSKVFSGVGSAGFAGGIEATQNSVLLVGRTLIGPPSSRTSGALIVRLSRAGNLLWRKAFNLPATPDEFSTVVKIANARYIAIGSSGNSILAVKISDSGSILWKKTMSLEGISLICKSALATLDGGLLLVGTTSQSNAFWIKLDSEGNVAWSKEIKGLLFEHQGCAIARGNAIAAYIACTVRRTAQPQSKPLLLVLTVFLDGQIVAGQLFRNGPGLWPYSISNSDDDGLIIAGQFGEPGAATTDGFLLKLGVGGTPQWTRRVRLPSSVDRILSVAQSPEGDIVATGQVGTSPLTWNLPLLRVTRNGGAAACKTLRRDHTNLPDYYVFRSSDFDVISDNFKVGAISPVMKASRVPLEAHTICN